MSELLYAEQKSFKSFIIFSFFSLVTLITFLSLFSSKYIVNDIRYESNLDLNYKSFGLVQGKSIWFIDESDFSQFYEDNFNVESLTISKQLPNLVFIDIDVYEKIIVISDLRETQPKQVVLYKNLYTELSESNNQLPRLTVTNGPIPDGFYSEIISLILTVNKYNLSIQDLSIIYNGSELTGSYKNTLINIGSPIDLSKKGSVVGYILEEGNCDGEVTIIDSNSEDIETLLNC
tara:strand:- start:324 stop:1022 length:699 start_codon:yes stop_codon:yes gene_type:complete